MALSHTPVERLKSTAMRTSDVILAAVMAALAGPALAGEAALSAAKTPSQAILAPSAGAAVALPLTTWSTARDAIRAGVKDYNAGNKLGAAQALEFAAGQGHMLALWKLGRMHSLGDGVPHNELRAFEYFSKIVDQFLDEMPGTQNAKVVSSAFTHLGLYLRDGIKDSYVIANPSRAADLLHYASSYYGDPDAQFYLSRMYLDGIGLAKSPMQAARWLNLAAEKGHIEAQSLLGQLMMSDIPGMPRQAAQGLMWMTLARNAADPVSQKNVIDSHRNAFEAASPTDREAAQFLLQRHMAVNSARQ